MPGMTELIIILVIVILLFGRGKISALMGDVAKGITSFRKGLAEGNEDTKDDDGETIDNETGEPVDKQDS
jgi:sec-independent protein translocase protein TatA